jgi:metal-sulfur cluster biosynthetic enzyme
MVGDVRCSGDDVVVEVALTTARCPLRSQIERDVTEAVGVVAPN